MAHTTLEELRKTVELLKEVETLQDADVRKQMQQRILAATTITPVEVAPQNGQKAEVPPPSHIPIAEAKAPASHARKPSARLQPLQPSSRDRSVATAGQHVAAIPAPGTDRSKVYEAVVILASREAPVSSADLERDLPGFPHEKISKTLSQLYIDGLLGRRQDDDTARDGNNRLLYKYYAYETGS